MGDLETATEVMTHALATVYKCGQLGTIICRCFDKVHGYSIFEYKYSTSYECLRSFDTLGGDCGYITRLRFVIHPPSPPSIVE